MYLNFIQNVQPHSNLCKHVYYVSFNYQVLNLKIKIQHSQVFELIKFHPHILIKGTLRITTNNFHP